MKPWIPISTKKIRLNRHRSMIKVRYRLPNNSAGDYYLFGTGRVVCALVLTLDRHVILIHQFRPGPQKFVIDLPGGGVNVRETPRKAIIRETLEETGFKGTPTLIARGYDDNYSRLVRYHYVIQNAVQISEPVQSPKEQTRMLTMDLSSFRNYLRTEKISDSKTAYLALDHLKLL